jgi:hypothetical protein
MRKSTIALGIGNMVLLAGALLFRTPEATEVQAAPVPAVEVKAPEKKAELDPLKNAPEQKPGAISSLSER